MPMQAGKPVIETTRLQLYELNDDDAPFVIRLLNEPAFHRNIGDRGVRSLADACRYIAEGPGASYRRHGFGLYRASLRHSGTAIGICGLIQRNFLTHPDIGFAFLEAHWRRGYALESAEAVLAHARTVLKLAEVMAIVAPGNTGSIRILEKLGLRYRQTIGLPGNARPAQLYSLGLRGTAASDDLPTADA
jgi:RimJ/RimL family protein N-acetyltransferase